MKVGIYYTSLKGRTKFVAYELRRTLENKGVVCDIYDIKDNYQGMELYEKVILLTPTYGAGKLPDEWMDVFYYLKEKDIKKTTFALCGTGNEGFYAATFVNALWFIYEFLSEKGAKIIGQTDRKDYNYVKSKSEIDGKLLGLGIDIMESPEEIENKINIWIEKNLAI